MLLQKLTLGASPIARSSCPRTLGVLLTQNALKTARWAQESHADTFSQIVINDVKPLACRTKLHGSVAVVVRN